MLDLFCLEISLPKLFQTISQVSRVKWQQCDQMARFFAQFLAFTTMFICPKALKKYQIRPKTIEISPNLVTLNGSKSFNGIGPRVMLKNWVSISRNKFPIWRRKNCSEDFTDAVLRRKLDSRMPGKFGAGTGRLF